MFVRVVLFLFAGLFTTCSSEPVGTGFSSDGSRGAETRPFDPTGGESRPPPVVCETRAPAETPEVERAMWREAFLRAARIMQRDPSNREAAVQIARAIPHALNASRGDACRALVYMDRYAMSACFGQSLEARAILRCYFDELAAACGDLEVVRVSRVRFSLYQRGCEPGEGRYQP